MPVFASWSYKSFLVISSYTPISNCVAMATSQGLKYSLYLQFNYTEKVAGEPPFLLHQNCLRIKKTFDLAGLVEPARSQSLNQYNSQGHGHTQFPPPPHPKPRQGDNSRERIIVVVILESINIVQIQHTVFKCMN